MRQMFWTSKFGEVWLPILFELSYQTDRSGWLEQWRRRRRKREWKLPSQWDLEMIFVMSRLLFRLIQMMGTGVSIILLLIINLRLPNQLIDDGDCCLLTAAAFGFHFSFISSSFSHAIFSFSYLTECYPNSQNVNQTTK